MKRLHLFEIEDQSWCPNIVRQSITDFLSGLYKLLGLFEPAFSKIEDLLHKTAEKTIVDCCSGSGGPMILLREYLDQKKMSTTKIILTDKYPNIDAFKNLEAIYGARLVGIAESVDVLQLPQSLKGIRCFFSSFHHFNEKQAVQILQDAVNHRAPIAIFESTGRTSGDFMRAFFSPILMMALMPFTKKLTLQKFFLMYPFPIIPLIFMFDYFVSNLRTYSGKEFSTLIKQLQGPPYHWEIGQLQTKTAKSQIPYLVGYPQ